MVERKECYWLEEKDQRPKQQIRGRLQTAGPTALTMATETPPTSRGKRDRKMRKTNDGTRSGSWMRRKEGKKEERKTGREESLHTSEEKNERYLLHV